MSFDSNLFEFFVDESPIPTIIIDSNNYNIVFLNKSTLGLFEYDDKKEFILDYNNNSIFPETFEYDVNLKEKFYKDLNNSSPQDIFFFDFKTKNNSIIKTILNIKKLSINENNYIILNIIKIDDRILYQYLDEFPDIIFIFDKDGNFIYANESATKITGYSKEEFLKLNISHIAEKKLILMYLRDFNKFSGEIEFLKKDGSIIILKIDILSTFNNNYICFCKDITDRNEINIQLKDQLYFLIALLDTIPAPVFYKDKNLRYLGCNKAFEEFTGLKKEDIKGKTVYDIAPREIAEIYDKKDRELLNSKKTQIYEWVVKRKDGEKKNVKFFKNVFYDSKGNVDGIVGTILDITDHLKYEEELKKSKNELEMINQQLEKTALYANEMAVKAELAKASKSIFLANMSHEIRNPLNAVIGMLKLLKDTELNETQSKYLKAALISAKNLTSLINDVLDLSKIETGKLSLEIKITNLREAIEECIDSVIDKIYEKNLEINIILEENVPLFIKTDETRLRQILLNLITNAVKFTDKGYINIIVEYVEKKEDNNIILKFTIEDTGIGIPEDKIKKLFHPFAQVENKLNKIYKGSGLGLAISKSLVELFKGKIGVESIVNKGSKFWFTIATEISDNIIDYEIDESIKNKNILIYDTDNGYNSLRSILRNFNITKINNEYELIKNNYNPDNTILIIEEEYFLKLKNQLISKFNNIIISRKNIVLKDRDVDYNFKYISKPYRLKEVISILSSKENKTVEKKEENLINDYEHKNKFNVLIAEDNEINQMVLSTYLEKFGIKADLASNGKEAIAMMNNKYYNLLFLDCHMPVMDGYETAIEVRNGKNVKNKDIFICAVTADVVKENIDKCYECGMNYFIKKPFDVEDIKNVLNMVLNNHKEEISDIKSEEISEPKQDIDIKEFNYNEILNKLDGDKIIVNKLINKLFDSIKNELIVVDGLILKNEFDNIKQIIHKLKGASGNLCFYGLYDRFRNLEDLIKNNRIDEFNKSLQETKDYYEHIKANIDRIIS